MILVNRFRFRIILELTFINTDGIKRMPDQCQESLISMWDKFNAHHCQMQACWWKDWELLQQNFTPETILSRSIDITCNTGSFPRHIHLNHAHPRKSR